MKAKKRFGQNFLTCAWVASAMLKAPCVNAQDTVLEIGPGKGALTQKLLQSGAKVIAVEKDRDLEAFLKDKFKDEIAKGQLVLYIKDIRDFVKDNLPKESYKLVANIPYYISGEILRMFLTAHNKPASITLLVQKEVAQRVVDNKESLLSLSVKFFGIPKLIKKVPAQCFAPQPKVDSAILHIELKSSLPYLDLQEEFFAVLRAAFASKRKKLINNLASICNKKVILEFFKGHNIKDTARAEELNLEIYLKLVSFMKNRCLK